MLTLSHFKNKLSLYLLAVVNSLSSSCAILTLMSLSSNFLLETNDGIASAGIQTCQYLSLATIGLFGGLVIRRFSPFQIGVLGPLICAIITFTLSAVPHVPIALGLPAVFVVFMLGGIEHPNLLRYFNEALKEDERITFFSFKESVSTFLSIFSPPFAAFLIIQMGVKACFLINSGIYLMSCIPWILFAYRKGSQYVNKSDSKGKWELGFKLILQNRELRLLNANRLLNHSCYVTWASILPILLAQNNCIDFSQEQGFCNSLASVGFLCTGFFVTLFSKKQAPLLSMVCMASFVGFSTLAIALSFPFSLGLFYLCAFLIGLGTYCFRISGITLGLAFTPKESLGPAIIAGDTIIRAWSFIVSLSVLFLYRQMTLGPQLIILLASLALAAPLIIYPLVIKYRAHSHSNS